MRTTAAVPAMGTATSRSLLVGVAAAVLAAGGCGGSTKRSSSSSRPATATSSAPAQPNATAKGFSWVRPGPAPANWRVARLASGAEMFYPPGWRRIRGDIGTVTAAQLSGEQRFTGYLNLTPRQGDERQATFAAFRLRHNASEGDRNVKMIDAAHGLKFRGGTGSCVEDTYMTTSGAHYVEIACLTAGPHSTSVIVGAAPPASWVKQRSVIERAISAVLA
jgi:hypothetical protein